MGGGWWGGLTLGMPAIPDILAGWVGGKQYMLDPSLRIKNESAPPPPPPPPYTPWDI